MPKGTIDRVLGMIKTGDDAVGVKLDTIRPILCALTGCTIAELEACEDMDSIGTLALIEKNKYLEEDVKRLKQEATNQRTFLANQIKVKDRYIAFLAIALAVCVLTIIIFLIMDRLNPNIGFFWLNR